MSVSGFPRTAFFQPVIRLFHLVALLDYLFENPEFIADSISEGRVFLRSSESMKHAASLPRPPLPSPISGSCRQSLPKPSPFLSAYRSRCHRRSAFTRAFPSRRPTRTPCSGNRPFHVAFAVFILCPQPALYQPVPQGKRQSEIHVPVPDCGGIFDERVFR